MFATCHRQVSLAGSSDGYPTLFRVPVMATWDDRWRRALEDQHRLIFDCERGELKKEYAQRVTCPVCNSSEARLYCEKDLFRYWRCVECSMVYMNPRLTDAATHAFYNSPANAIYNESKFNAPATSNDLDDAANLANLERIIAHSGSATGRLLEIGSAKGHFLGLAAARGFEVHGLELNEDNWRASRAELGDTVLNLDLSAAGYPDRHFDVIYMRDVIAHLPRPREFLLECARIAKPGCTLFIDTHNIDGLIHKVVKGRHTTLFGFMEPHHWSPRTITRICELTGFTVREIRFESLDCTVAEMVRHFRGSTFTTVYPSQPGPGRRILFRLLHSLFTRRPLRTIDRAVTPRLANVLGQGSVMRVLAEKTS